MWDCIEQLGRSKYDYMSTIDLRDAFHTLRLAPMDSLSEKLLPYKAERVLLPYGKDVTFVQLMET